MDLDGYQIFGLCFIVFTVFVSIVSGGSFGKRHPVLRRRLFYTLTGLVLLTYTFFILIDTVNGQLME